MNPELEQLAAWGYAVEPSRAFDGVTVYFVAGFGLTVYVRDDDADALASLANANAHAERVAQQGETSDQTLARWIREGRVPAPYTEDVVAT